MFLFRGAAGFTHGALKSLPAPPTTPCTRHGASEPNGFPAEDTPKTLFSLIQILTPGSVCSASSNQKHFLKQKNKSVTFTVRKLLQSLLHPHLLPGQQKCGISMGLALQMKPRLTLLLTAQFYSSWFTPSSTAARVHCGIKLSVPRAAQVCNYSLLALCFLTLP